MARRHHRHRGTNTLSSKQDIAVLRPMTRIPKTKNKESHTVPLTSLAIDVLKLRKKRAKTPFVFPSDGADGHYVEPKIAWRQLLKDAKLANLRMHDLRRTMGSYMAMSNQSLPFIGKDLGHKSHTSTQNLRPSRSGPRARGHGASPGSDPIGGHAAGRRG